ncbi:L-rhamnose-binding lectin SML-like [Micropterus salmoides]|uniref:L-rhamnose-binding lectin SML-like n=1 Tax=Micropterus salmoides TaxID=27706 RepID=UPI0018ECAA29|nr:L-rhamnose-binding lectin SML-like [Micropterus salmoides]XP_038577643.1 L-rhamnose-binding lectin SML-like [Micropterus salmoides]
MLHSRLSITLLLAATCLLMRAGHSGAQQVSPNFPTTSFTERVITCDDDLNVHRLSCESGVIFVQTALYGRADKTTCSEGRPPQQLANTQCSHPDTLDIMRKRCNGKRVCELNTNTFRASDPCIGIYKYLDTTYTCLPAFFSITCERSLASLQCDEGQVILVYSADYGRRDPTTCSYRRPVSDVLNVCSLPTSKVAESCNGKNSCTIRAVNSVFGDPCGTTYKYLEVAYTCQYPGI